MIKKVSFVHDVVINHERFTSINDQHDVSMRYAKRDFAEGILISYPDDDGRVGICYVPMSNVKYVIEDSVER